MKLKLSDFVLAVFGIIVVLMCFACTGADFALSVKHFVDKEYIHSVCFFLIGAFLFVRGFKLLKVCKELIVDIKKF